MVEIFLQKTASVVLPRNPQYVFSTLTA